MCVCVCVCVCVCCAFVGLDNKLYKMHGTYIKKTFYLFTVTLTRKKCEYRDFIGKQQRDNYVMCAQIATGKCPAVSFDIQL